MVNDEWRFATNLRAPDLALQAAVGIQSWSLGVDRPVVSIYTT